MVFLDNNKNILKWASEEVSVKYFHPFKKRFCNYFPDFLVKCKTKTGVKTYLIEIKPYKQTNLSKRMSDNSKAISIVNLSKFSAAKKLCQHEGWEFLVLTEKNVNFIK